jgi:cation diffusion facilitator family transporter
MVTENRMKERSHRSEIQRVTWAGLIVNLLLSAAKCVAGLVGGSQAVFADGIHSLSDLTTDAAILLGVRYWTKPADSDHPHGHQRIENLVTFGIALILAAVGTGLLWNAVATLHRRHATSPGWIAFAAAMVSIVAKEALYHWTLSVGRRIRSMPLVANAWHHRSDALSSIPVALAVAGAAIEPSWAFLDHVGAVVVSFFIYQAAFRIAKPAFDKLIDTAAPPEQLARIRAAALETEGVRGVHAIRTRYSGGSTLIVDLHIMVAADMTVREGHGISGAVKARLLAGEAEVMDVLVHIEPSEYDAPEGAPDATD